MSIFVFLAAICGIILSGILSLMFYDRMNRKRLKRVYGTTQMKNFSTRLSEYAELVKKVSEEFIDKTVLDIFLLVIICSDYPLSHSLLKEGLAGFNSGIISDTDLTNAAAMERMHPSTQWLNKAFHTFRNHCTHESDAELMEKLTTAFYLVAIYYAGSEYNSKQLRLALRHFHYVLRVVEK